MANLATQYAGLTLANPLIIASSGLTKDSDGVKKAADSGAGAVVLRSVFEEEIMAEVAKIENDFTPQHPEAYEYLLDYNLNDYLNLIEKCKRECTVPIIASINCAGASSWISYANKIQAAGADALEVNVAMLPAREKLSHPEFDQRFYEKAGQDLTANYQDSLQIESVYYEVLKELKKHISIPVIFKIGPYFTSLIHFARALDKHHVSALTLFNWFFTPDFDIDTKEVIHKIALSDPQSIGNTLRWVTLLHNEIKCDLSATTGIHDAESCIKLVMAGASTVQLCSVIYKNGFSVVGQFLDEISSWMDSHGYASMNDLKGAIHKHMDTQVFNRMQYIKQYTDSRK